MNHPIPISSRIKDSHCSYCGSKFAEQKIFPRRCWTCHNDTWANPLPVVVALISANTPDNGWKRGVIIQRRNIEPGKGKMALPGGYIDLGETWQEACAREVREEIGLITNPMHYSLFGVNMGNDNNTILIFAEYNTTVSWESVNSLFVANEEVSLVDLAYTPQELAFPSHTNNLTNYLNS